MIANLIIGGLIFGYAGYAMWKFINRSRQGKCAACDIKESCSNNSCHGSK